MNGGFIAEEDPQRDHRQADDVINVANAGNHVARNLQDLRNTSGRCSEHDLLLLAATQGAVP